MRKAKRGATIRAGFTYQDLVAAQSLLSLITEFEFGPVSVRLEATDAGSVDDVVEEYPDRIVYKQVKWSAHPLSDAYSIQSLARTSPAKKTSLIAALAKTWTSQNKAKRPFTLELVSNRHADAEFQGLLTSDPAHLRNVLSRTDRKALQPWMTATGLAGKTFDSFVQSLRFRLDHKNVDSLRNEISHTLKMLGAPRAAFNALITAIGRWSTDPTVKQLARSDVEAALGIRGTIPDNTFLIDKATLVSRRNIHATLATMVQRHPGAYVAVLGPPGAGKSTALNTLDHESALTSSATVLVYNCFTGPNDANLRTRAGMANLVEFMVLEMHRHFAGSWHRRRAEPNEFETVLEEASRVVGSHERLVIILDGLDYAKSNAQPGDIGIWASLPPKLPSNVTLVVSAQAKDQLPEHLRSLPSKSYLSIPPLTHTQVREMAAKLGVFVACHASRAHEQSDVVDALFDKAKGHALQTVYAARWLCDKSPRVGRAAAALKQLPDFGDDIAGWYARLPRLADAYARALVREMAICPFAISAAEANAFLSSPRDEYAAADALKDMGFMFHQRGNEWLFRHDSLRAFAMKDQPVAVQDAQKHFRFLQDRRDDPRAGESIGHAVEGAGQHDWAFQAITPDWLMRQLANGARQRLVRASVERLLQDAVARKNWLHSARWALILNRNTSETSHHLDYRLIDRCWIASDKAKLILRRVTDGEQLHVSPVGAFSVAEQLRQAGHESEAAELTRLAATTPLDIDEQSNFQDWNEEIIPYVAQLALHIPVRDCVTEIHDLVKRFAAQQPATAIKDRNLPRELAEHAAFSCLWEEQWESVEEWCKAPSRLLSARTSKLLLAAAGLRRSTKQMNAVILTALKSEPPLWMIHQASRQTHYREAATRALRSRPLPSELVTVPQWSYYERDEALVRAVRELYEDCRCSIRLGLRDRVDALVAQTPVAPWNKEKLLYALTLRVARALPSSATAHEWSPAATAIVATLRESRFSQLHRGDQLDQAGLGQALLTLLSPIFRRADRANESSTLIDWCKGDLLPALRDTGLTRDCVMTPLIFDFLCHVSQTPEQNRFFGEEEHRLDVVLRHKAVNFQTLAASSAECGRSDEAWRLLHKGTRAAFSYGYRKDITVLIVQDCLALLGQDLAEQFGDHVARIGAALEVIESITDLDELRDAAGEFVAAVACTDLSLSVRVAALIGERLDGSMFRAGLPRMFAARGIDLTSAQAAFQSARVPFSGPYPRSQTLSPAAASLPTSLPDLVAMFRSLNSSQESRQDFNQRDRVVAAIIERVRDKQSLREAALLLFDEYQGYSSERQSLIGAARKAGLHTEARALVERVVQQKLSEDRWYWSWGEVELIKLCAAVEPALAQRVVLAASERSAHDGPEMMGFSFVHATIIMLAATGQRTEAVRVFNVLADHLRDLLSPYPTPYAEWRSALSIQS